MRKIAIQNDNYHSVRSGGARNTAGVRMKRGKNKTIILRYLTGCILLSACLLILPEQVKAVANSLIEVKTAAENLNPGDWMTRQAKGRFVIGQPEDKALLFGYPSPIWSSVTSVLVESPGNTLVCFGGNTGNYVSGPADSSGNTMNTTVWEISGMRITQNLFLAENPRGTGTVDSIGINYVVENTNTVNAGAGIRIMLDTYVVSDNSPIIAEGEGHIKKEREWTGADVPEAWRSVDNYLDPQLEAECVLGAGGAAVPDRLVIGQWDNMNEFNSLWTYTLDDINDIDDTAAAMYWGPDNFLPGEKKEYTIFYGVPGPAGGKLDIEKTVDMQNAFAGDTLSYNITYSNIQSGNITSVYIWDTIPSNTVLVDASGGAAVSGDVVFWPAGDILQTDPPKSVWFLAAITGYSDMSVENTAVGSYINSYWDYIEGSTSNTVVTDIYTPTITPSPTITPTSTITPTPEPELNAVFKGSYPDPAWEEANIIVRLNTPADITVRIFTLAGEETTSIEYAGRRGVNNIKWKLKNAYGRNIASGVYIIRILAEDARGQRREITGKIGVAR